MNDFIDVTLESIVKRVKVGFVGSIEKFYCKKELGVPLLRTLNLTSNGIDYSDLKYVTKEFFEKNKKSQIKKGDILIARHGDNGKACVYEREELAQALNVVVIEPDEEKISTYLLAYFLEMPYVKQQISASVGGSVQGVINTQKIAELLIPFRKTINYKKIEEFILLIDNKRKRNDLINKELETMTRTIYDYWFLQFNFPDENGKPYKSSGGKMVWNEELKREIPEGWNVGTLNHYIVRDKGGDWGKDKEEGNYSRKVTCLRGADFPAITGNVILEAPKRFILKKNADKLLEHGDLIIEISGGSPTQSTGRICYINDSLLERFGTDVITSNFCKAISLKNITYMYWFYVQWKKIYESNILYKYESKTTGIKNLLFDMFVKDYKIVQPSDEIIFKYNEKVEGIFEKIQKNQKESQELVSLRDFLLPLLMNGQVGFKEC